MLDKARLEVWLVAFAAYDVQEVRKALERARSRGVVVSLLLESKLSSDGKVSFDGIAALRSVVDVGAQVYEWPLAMRTKDSKGRHGSLHVKACVVDRAALLVSSANLTGHAFDLNMELGVLLREGDQPLRFADHLAWLAKSGTIVPAVLD